MKVNWIICLVVLVAGISAKAELMSIVEDDFNSYNNGSIVGQGGWESYVNGGDFIVQETTVFEGEKALYCSTPVDSVIGKQGPLRTDGRQAVYVRTENRDGWGFYQDGNAQVRISKDLWGSPGHGQYRSNISVSFKKDGHVAYQIDSGFVNFATYDDNMWTLVEMEWRSNDKTARYRVNSGIWTNWEPIIRSDLFTEFDYVGFDLNYGGSGGVFFDTLTIPEPSTITLLIIGVIASFTVLLKKMVLINILKIILTYFYEPSQN